SGFGAKTSKRMAIQLLMLHLRPLRERPGLRDDHVPAPIERHLLKAAALVVIFDKRLPIMESAIVEFLRSGGDFKKKQLVEAIVIAGHEHNRVPLGIQTVEQTIELVTQAVSFGHRAFKPSSRMFTSLNPDSVVTHNS